MNYYFSLLSNVVPLYLHSFIAVKYSPASLHNNSASVHHPLFHTCKDLSALECYSVHKALIHNCTRHPATKSISLHAQPTRMNTLCRLEEYPTRPDSPHVRGHMMHNHLPPHSDTRGHYNLMNFDVHPSARCFQFLEGHMFLSSNMISETSKQEDGHFLCFMVSRSSPCPQSQAPRIYLESDTSSLTQARAFTCAFTSERFFLFLAQTTSANLSSSHHICRSRSLLPPDVHASIVSIRHYTQYRRSTILSLILGMWTPQALELVSPSS
jgi:hypothetical protein